MRAQEVLALLFDGKTPAFMLNETSQQRLRVLNNYVIWLIRCVWYALIYCSNEVFFINILFLEGAMKDFYFLLFTFYFLLTRPM